MSGSQKQSAAGGPQTQRYSTPQYQPLLPQPQNNFTGSEAYPVTSPPGSYAPQGQGPNQGPGMRGLAPAGPPNQSSTPPNNDLKVQGITGPIPQMQFVHQAQVRPTQSPYYQPRGPSGPSNQTPRMATSQQHRAPVYPAGPYIVPYMVTSPMIYANTNQRQPAGMIAAQPYPQQVFQQQIYPNFTQPPSGYSMPYPYPQQTASIISRSQVAPAATAAPPNAAPANMPAAPIMPTVHQNYISKGNPKQRRPNAIPIVDPTTGEDKLNEIFEESNSHPASGESSARQTPQPAAHNTNKEIQAAFAKQVAQAIKEDKQPCAPPTDHPQPLHDAAPQEHYQPPPPQQSVQLPGAVPYNVETSTLHYDAKEFVSKQAKESTPIVSANSDAVEVIIHKKESPAKGKRQQEKREPKSEPPKETPKEPECDKISSIAKEDETSVPTPIIPDSPVVPEACPVPKEILDKKGAKKPSPVEQKAPETVETQPTAAECTQLGTGKSRNAHRNKLQQVNNAKQPPPQAQPAAPPQQQPPTAQPPLPVPTPQPPKPNNKSSKSKELNMKGASKEGSDMDAFNDNNPKGDQRIEVNANSLPSSNEGTRVSSSDLVNANAVQPTPPVIEPPPVVANTEVSSGDTTKDTNENITTEITEQSVNGNVPIPPVTATNVLKATSKPFDVTSIIKESPKTIMPSFAINDSARDETDRALVQNEKPLVAKNDVSAKVNLENSINDIKSQLPYKPGQWAPDKPTGKKVYEKDFLMALKDYPASRQKPDNIEKMPECVIQDERSRQLDPRNSMGGGRTDFSNVPFMSYGGKSGSQRGGPITKRNSQSGKMGSRGGDKSSSKPQPKVSISLRGDVKLHESENAWKPARFKQGENMTDEDKKTEALYKRVRSVLNKLTPQKFDTLVNQVRQLKVDTKERLQGVIDLVFDKAIDEPNFSVAYAKMCKELQVMQVEGDDKKSFRTLMITKCQMEFEKQSVNETERNNKLKEIEEASDPEKKKDLLFELEEYDRKLRMKSVGCIRFIGELFKQQMLTAAIMKRCLQTLLENKDEESLECLCKLLTTVGKELESKNVDLSGIFDEMKRITDGKRQKVSSRIRFMLQDVIELRNSKWVPRRGDLNPKTIDQIQKEAENEQMNIHIMNMGPRKDDRGPRGGGGGGGGSRQKTLDEGWSPVPAGSRSRASFQFQTEKMRAAKNVPLIDEPFGSSSLFGTWGKGAAGSKNAAPPLGPSNNMFAALDNLDNERRPSNSRSSKDPYSSKGPSLERSSYKSSYDGRGSRSGSQHRDTPMRGNMPPPAAPSSLPPASVAPASSKPAPAATPAPQVPKLTQEQVERRIRNSAEEYLGGFSTPNEFYQDIAQVVAPEEFSTVVYECYNFTLEKSTTSRLKTGELFAKLIKSGNLPLDSFIAGFQELSGLGMDLVIDIPHIWQNFAEGLVHLITEEALSMNNLQKLFDSLIKDRVAKKVLSPLFSLIVKDKGPNFLTALWSRSGLQLTDFIMEDEVEAFLKEHDLVSQSAAMSYEEIHQKLREFFRNKAEFDDIVNWISANVGENVTKKEFIRTLATAIFEDSVTKNKLVPETLAGHVRLIQKYVDNNRQFELQCLYALQALCHSLEHPQGLLLSFCNKLYDDNTFCQESFEDWESSTDPAEQEGKGVALKQLTSFFTQLKENDDDEDYSSEDA